MTVRTDRDLAELGHRLRARGFYATERELVRLRAWWRERTCVVADPCPPPTLDEPAVRG